MLSSKKCHPWDEKCPFLLDQESILNVESHVISTSNSSSSAQIIGTRSTMEDRILITSDFCDNLYSLYVVADGHSGDACSEYIVQNIESILSRELSLNCVKKALFNTFTTLNSDFNEDSSGSTIVAALFEKSTSSLYVANVGDSRAILLRNNKAYKLTMDHKVSNDAEVARLINNGGYVCMKRAFGTLAITRTIGDSSVVTSDTTMVSYPEITSIPVQRNDLIVIACDGLFDGLSSINDILSYVNTDLDKFALDLVNAASSERVVCDNTSVIITRYL